MRGRVGFVAILAATAGCFDASSLVFDLDGGSKTERDASSDASTEACGTFETPAASSLVTEFATDGGVSLGWTAINPCATEEGGDVVASPAPGNASFCQYATSATYHLTCDAITMRVPKTTTSEVGVQTFVYVVPSVGDPIQIVLEGGAFTESKQFPIADTTFSPAADLWWRLGGDGGHQGGPFGMFTFETSPDGLHWNTKASFPSPASLDSVRIHVGAGEDTGGISNPGQARFDCYNVAPVDCR